MPSILGYLWPSRIRNALIVFRFEDGKRVGEWISQGGRGKCTFNYCQTRGLWLKYALFKSQVLYRTNTCSLLTRSAQLASRQIEK